MLSDNGRSVKQRHNYHMSLDEFKILLNYVKEHCGLQYHIMILLQYVMGWRASELVSCHLLDFKSKFCRVDYRCAKTNEIIYNSPVPKPVAELIKTYVTLEGHRLKYGFLFPAYTRMSNKHLTAQYYETWFAKIRKEIGKKYPRFLDKYIHKSNRTTYRIGTHSLRRLHRTTLKNNIKDLYLVKELCNYRDWESFERYINHAEIENKREQLLTDIFNPLVKDLWTGSSEQSRLSNF